MTQTQLAELLKITPQAVSRWEMGVSYPDIAMIPLISKILWVSADELLGIDPSVSDPCLNQDQIDNIFDFPYSVSGESKKVLVVDDADFMRMVLKDIVTHKGHAFLEAKNGQECLNILQNEAVDVCVLDIHMPEMDGMEVLKQIKEDHPEIKVVMLSALCSERSVKTALLLGADAFVAKPFQEECLVSRIG